MYCTYQHLHRQLTRPLACQTTNPLGAGESAPKKKEKRTIGASPPTHHHVHELAVALRGERRTTQSPRGSLLVVSGTTQCTPPACESFYESSAGSSTPKKCRSLTSIVACVDRPRSVARVDPRDDLAAHVDYLRLRHRDGGHHHREHVFKKKSKKKWTLALLLVQSTYHMYIP